jgi:hypothetical protein
MAGVGGKEREEERRVINKRNNAECGFKECRDK